MCGVCGVVGLGTDADRVRVHAMMDALLHRGPDDAGIGGPATALLGVTRLAIRGVDSGRQPITDAETGVLAVCNGEIDNHEELRAFLASRGRAVTMRTDVAVLPALYLELGEDFVKELVGAFAIALYDPRHERLILARDRAGERPLFYMRTHDGVTFATEISALATDPSLRLTVDREALARYMRFGSFTAPASPFCEIRKVAPAERIVFEGGEVRCERTWRWPVGRVDKVPASLDRFDAIFRRAVHLQSENDVPFGVFLSGGVDSSLVTAVAKTLRPDADFSAFTLRFSEASYDEGDAAALVARTLGVRAVPVWVKPDDFPREVSRLISMVGEPLADPAWIPTALLARRAAEDVKVALVGEGADELFGGYPTYIGALVSGRYAALPAWIKAPIRRAVEAWPPGDKKVTLSFLLKKFVAGAELSGEDRHLLWTSNIPPDLLRRLGVEPPRGEHGRASLDPRLRAAARSGDLARRGAAHQGRPGQHELGPGAARAVPGPRRDGVRRHAARGGPRARDQDQGLPQALRDSLPSRANRSSQEARSLGASGRLASRRTPRLGRRASGRSRHARGGSGSERGADHLEGASRAQGGPCARDLDAGRPERVAGLGRIYS